MVGSVAHLHVAALIPDSLTPQEVIHALHDHENALTPQALTSGHKELDSTHPETLKDTWWYPVDQHHVKTYEVTEGVIIIPGIGEWGKKYITFPSCFQNFNYGIRTRADSSGVILRAEFKVIPGGADIGEVDGEGEGVGYANWVLVEDVKIETSWWMMPFVRKQAEGAHRDICKKLIEKISKLKAEGKLEAPPPEDEWWKAVNEKEKGKGKSKDKDLPIEPAEEGSSRPEAGPLPQKVTYR